MSGQYPGGGYNNPLAGHRGQFNPQQQQQQLMNQMQMGGSAGAGGGMMAGAGGGPGGGGMMSMGGAGGYGQGGMMSQQGNPMQQQGMQGMAGSAGAGGMGPGVMNPVGMQSPSHVQQQLMQQQMQQQMGPMGPQMTMGMAGHVGMVGGSGAGGGGGGGSPQVSNIMPQQQQMQQNVGMQQTHQMQAGPSGPNMGAMLAQQQQSLQQQPSQQSPAGQLQQQSSIQPQPQQMPQTSGQHQPQQQQQSQPSSNNVLSISQQPHKEINIVTLSRVGQETVQDITSRFQEIFTALKVIQPTSSRDNGTVKKVQEHFRTIRLLFKRMRLIYERCSDGYPQGMEYTHVESLIPYKDETDHRNLEGTQCEEYRKALQENQELIDTVKLKNRQLREIIDRTRIIVWEINTMLSMRRS